MTLRTKESLQRMFQESREQQKKKKEQQSKLKLEARKEKYKEIDQILKKSLREERKKIMDNLSTLIKKTPQEPQKPSQIELENYQDRWMLWETNESDLYTTREELQEWEDEHYPCINWDKWNQLVEQTKKEIEMLINQ